MLFCHLFDRLVGLRVSQDALVSTSHLHVGVLRLQFSVFLCGFWGSNSGFLFLYRSSLRYWLILLNNYFFLFFFSFPVFTYSLYDVIINPIFSFKCFKEGFLFVWFIGFWFLVFFWFFFGKCTWKLCLLSRSNSHIKYWGYTSFCPSNLKSVYASPHTSYFSSLLTV